MKRISDEEINTVLDTWGKNPEGDYDTMVAQAQLDSCENEHKEKVREIFDWIGLNCYTVWGEVNDVYGKHICIDPEWLQALKQEVNNES